VGDGYQSLDDESRALEIKSRLQDPASRALARNIRTATPDGMDMQRLQTLGLLNPGLIHRDPALAERMDFGNNYANLAAQTLVPMFGPGVNYNTQYDRPERPEERTERPGMLEQLRAVAPQLVAQWGM